MIPISNPIRLLIFNEFIEEFTNKAMRKLYPNGIHQHFIEKFTGDTQLQISTATFDEPDHGFSSEKLSQTDVIVYWSHIKNEEFRDEIVDRLYHAIEQGIGIIFLHSAHMAKIFQKVLGTSGNHPWKNDGKLEKIWCVQPNHPIAIGIPNVFELPKEEKYFEPFEIPTPQELIFISGFQNGDIIRSGMTWRLGKGKIFYFRPGHETYPTFSNPNVLKIIRNAITWAKKEE